MLRFKSNNFRILVLSDVQAKRVLNKTEKQVLSNIVKTTNPDLVVFLGDMISGLGYFTKNKVEKTIHSIIETTAGSNIPFVVLSGNHDRYAFLPYFRQLDIYKTYQNCLTPVLANRPCQSCFTLDIENQGLPVFRLLFNECAGTTISQYGIGFRKASPEMRECNRIILNSSICPPTILFQHIVVPDVFRLLTISDEKSEHSVEAYGPYHEKFLTLKHPATGILGECPCPSWDNTEQFSDWVESKNVKAAVFAHDHKNSFVDTLDGITFIQTPTAGLTCYGDDSVRGAYVLDLSDSGVITPRAIYYKSMTT